MVLPLRFLRLVMELVFVFLGGLVVWLGWTGYIFFDRRKTSWLAVSVVVTLWGLRALYKPGKWLLRSENWTRGLSLTLLGAIMLAISRVPFAWVGPLLAAGGVLLILRGILGSVLALWPHRAHGHI